MAFVDPLAPTSVAPPIRDAPASTSVTIAAALFGAMLASVGSVAASVVGHAFSLDWLAASAAIVLVAWGGAYGAFAARRHLAGRPALYVAWGFGLVGLTVVLSIATTIVLLVIEDTHGHGTWWPLDRIFEGLFGCGSTLVLGAAATGVACMCVPLVGRAARGFVSVSESGGAPRVVRVGVLAVCAAAALKLVLDWTNVGFGTVLFGACGATLLALRAVGAGRAFVLAPLVLLAADATAHGLRWSWETSARVADDARYTAPCCYTTRTDVIEPSAGRGAYALAAEAVPGVAHARATYAMGYSDPVDFRPRVDVAVELAPGVNEAQTLASVQAALALVLCSNCDGAGGQPEMSPHVMLGHAVPLDIDVEVALEPGADGEALRPALMTLLERTLCPHEEYFFARADEPVGRIIGLPSTTELPLPGVRSFSWTIAGATVRENGAFELPLEAGDHATVGHLEIRVARPEADAGP